MVWIPVANPWHRSVAELEGEMARTPGVAMVHVSDLSHSLLEPFQCMEDAVWFSECLPIAITAQAGFDDDWKGRLRQHVEPHQYLTILPPH